MSLDALDWAFRFPVTGAHKAVLLALAHHADPSGRCYPSEARLILYSGVKERALRYALRELEDMEAITTNCSRGGRRASEYALSLGLVAPVSPPGSGSATRNRRRNGSAGGHEMPLNGHIVGHEMPPNGQVEGHEMPLNGSSGAPNAPLNSPPSEVRGASGAPEGGIKCPSGGHLVPPKSHRTVIEEESSTTTLVPVSAQKAAAAPWTGDAELVWNAWNTMAKRTGLACATVQTGKRRRGLENRLKEHGLDGVLDGIDRIGRSAFCRGAGSKGWKADFDFLLQSEGLTAAREGRYDDRTPKATGWERYENPWGTQPDGWAGDTIDGEVIHATRPH